MPIDTQRQLLLPNGDLGNQRRRILPYTLYQTTH
jgi:hypothetical protein